MRIFSIAAIAGLVLGFVLTGATSATAQTEEVPTTPHKRVFGFQDPLTGEFHPLGKFHGPVPDVATTPALTGTLEVVVKITLKTPVPKGGVIVCSADFIASSISLTSTAVTTYDESASVLATVAGSAATCTVKVPYSWVLPAASATVHDSLDGSLVVTMFAPATTTTAIEEGLTRTNGQDIVSATKLPANGATTVYDKNVTL
jgi:hypothetical protein